ncbi:hypothetical protein LINPERHAP1_LOCUS10796 [Linum perenne]
MELGPYSFDQSLLVMIELKKGEQLNDVELHHVDFRVQMHELPRGYCSEAVGKALGNYVGRYVKYDDRNYPTTGDYFMRVRFTLDVRLPLKREKKVKLAGGIHGICKFHYERLPNFCYICGKICHIDRYCEGLFHVPENKIVRLWDKKLRAPPKKEKVMEGEKWLERRDTTFQNMRVGSGLYKQNIGESGGMSGDMEKEGRSQQLPRGVAALLDNLGASTTTKLTYIKSSKVIMEEELTVQDDKKDRRGGRRGKLWWAWSILEANLRSHRRKEVLKQGTK